MTRLLRGTSAHLMDLMDLMEIWGEVVTPDGA
jgi:hypothetical protein